MGAEVKAFFDGLPGRVGVERTRGVDAAYVFEIEDAGTWTVDVRDTGLTVTDSALPGADCTIATSTETFLGITSGKQGAVGAYFAGKLRLTGDLSVAMKLQQLF